MLNLEVGKLYYFPKINHFVRVVEIIRLEYSPEVFIHWINQDKDTIRDREGYTIQSEFINSLESSEMNHGFEQLSLNI